MNKIDINLSSCVTDRSDSDKSYAETVRRLKELELMENLGLTDYEIEFGLTDHSRDRGSDELTDIDMDWEFFSRANFFGHTVSEQVEYEEMQVARDLMGYDLWKEEVNSEMRQRDQRKKKPKEYKGVSSKGFVRRVLA